MRVAGRHTRLLIAIGLITIVLTQTGCAFIARVTQTYGGDVAEGTVGHFDIDGTGRYVVYDAFMFDIVPGPLIPGRIQVYRRDLWTDTTVQVDLGTDGSPANGDGFTDVDSVSDGGRFVLFGSAADNLVAGDDNGVADLFVRDLQTGTTDLVNRAADGTASAAAGMGAAMSADGRYVVFTSTASDLVAAPVTPAGEPHLYVRDRQAGTTRLVTPKPVDSLYLRLSADGSTAAFMSNRNDLVPGDTGTWDDFVVSVASGAIERVNVSSSEAEADHSIHHQPTHGALSATGRYVVFDSPAPNLVPDDTNGKTDVFVRDRVTGTTERVSVTSAGDQSAEYSGAADVDASGRIVSFQSLAGLVPEDTGAPSNDVYVHDRVTGQTTRVSTTTVGGTPNAWSFGGQLSGDGRLALWTTFATDVAGPEPEFEFGTSHLFVQGTVTPSIISATPATVPSGMTTSVTLHGRGFRTGTGVTISGSGAAVTSSNVVDDTTMTLTISVSAGTTAGGRALLVSSPPAGPNGLGVVVTACGACLQIGP